jgi:hypothetical protein
MPPTHPAAGTAAPLELAVSFVVRPSRPHISRDLENVRARRPHHKGKKWRVY